ncbi:unnamed protein product [Heterobilharzia americana]|nr:unnamed protein product [Heterobilharzia americana]
MTAKLSSDTNYDLEQQFILRMTDTLAAQNLAADIEAGIPFKESFTIEFKPDMRHTIVRYNGQVYQGQIMDLPCIIESLKTTDKKNFYKTADICQMMICTQGDQTGPLRGTAAYLDSRPGSRNKTFDIGHENREFQFLHGITPPLKNVLHRRFRKTRRKRFVDMPKIEKEVKQLLRADLQAVNVKWEVIWTDPPAPMIRANAKNNLGTLNTESGSGDDRLGNQHPTADDEIEDEDEDGTRAYAIDHRDVFGEISSSSMGSSTDSDDSSSSSRGEGRDRRNRRRRGAGSSGHLSDNDENEPSSLIGRDGREKGKHQLSKQNQNCDSIEIGQSSSTTTYKNGESVLTTVIPSGDNGTASVTVSESNNLGNLKDELAAELLLSDSGDEQDDTNNDLNVSDAVGGIVDEIGGGIVDDDDDLQTSVVAELVANSVNTNCTDVGGISESLHRMTGILVEI